MVIVRTSLQRWEDRKVYFLLKIILEIALAVIKIYALLLALEASPVKYDTSPRSPERLVCR